MQFEYVFRPLKLGQMELSNRVLFNDITRCRVDLPSRSPNPLVAEYYAQRATSGLILTEPTMVMPGHSAYYYEPGLYTDTQVEGWRLVAKRVHEANGRIFAALDHGGRLCHSINEGSVPLAPSSLAATGNIPPHFNRTRQAVRYETPRAMTTADVEAVKAAFVNAARRAIDAGLDGVEVLASDEHLFYQFADPSINTRTDAYGKDVVGLSKLLLETIAAIGDAIGSHRVGVRVELFSSSSQAADGYLQYLCSKLQEAGVAFLHLVHGTSSGGTLIDARRYFKGPIIASGPQITLNIAESAIAGRRIDAVAMGNSFCANPDLIARLKTNEPLNEMRQAFLFTRGAEGYVDYPSLHDEES